MRESLKKVLQHFFQIIDEDETVWIDVSFLPNTVIFCAMHDGASLIQVKVGKHKRKKRLFLPLEWLINDWGAGKKVVEELKKVREGILKEMPRLRKEYW